MYAGRMDRFIDIQRAQQTQSPSGAPVTTWINLATRRPASLERRRDPIEVAGNAQVMASDQVEFRVRYASALVGLTPKDRVIYPAVKAPATQPAAYEIFNIIAVSEIGRREGLRIIAWCKPDAS